MLKSQYKTLVRKYLIDNPTMSTRALAEMLHFEYPDLFNTVGTARTAVRYYRGLNGNASYGLCKDPIPFTPYVPVSQRKPVYPVQLGVKGNGAIIADTHMPYHDHDAIKIAIQHIMEQGNTDFLLILGDLADCYQESYYSRDPRLRRFPEEITIVKEFLEEMTDIFDKVIFKFGNHERRHETYMRYKAPDLLGIPGMDLHEIYELNKMGIRYIPWNVVIQAGKLTLLHGHEYGRSVYSPVNPARGMFLKAKSSTVSAHMHQTSQHSENNIRGTETSCWSLGCLCDLNPEYRPLNRWNHGFALMEFDGDQNFDIDNKRIIQGKVY